jgi:SpoIIAA-like
MIEKIPNLPENVLGFSAKGKITANDYEFIIIPAVEELFSRQEKVRFLYHLGDDVTGFEADAMWDDTKLGLKHLQGWERLAIVSDIEWVRAAVKIFRLVIPGHVRIFNNSELTEAKKWISE